MIDEYGGFEGIVTVADLATRVLGLEEDRDSLVQRDDGSWLVDAMMNFDDFAKAIGLRTGDEEHDTVAGFARRRSRRNERLSVRDRRHGRESRR